MKTCGKVGGKSDGEMSHIKKAEKHNETKNRGKTSSLS